MHASRARALKIGIIVFVAACAISIPVYRFGNATEASRHAQLSSDIEEPRKWFSFVQRQEWVLPDHAARAAVARQPKSTGKSLESSVYLPLPRHQKPTDLRPFCCWPRWRARYSR